MFLALCSKVWFSPGWVFQQDNNLNHHIKCTKEWVQIKKFQVLEWTSKNPDQNIIEYMRFKLKKGVHARIPGNIEQLWELCQAKWSNSGDHYCQKLLRNCRKRLVHILTSKEGVTKH